MDYQTGKEIERLDSEIQAIWRVLLDKGLVKLEKEEKEKKEEGKKK